MPNATERVDMRELYEALRGYENAIRYLADNMAGALLIVPDAKHKTITVGKVAADDLEKTRLGRNHPCVTPPYCITTAEAFAREVGIWMSRGPAFVEAAAALAREIPGQEIPFVPSARPGWNYPEGRHPSG